MKTLQISEITPPEKLVEKELRHKIDTKTKPYGSLGKLEAIALKIGIIQNSLYPVIKNPSILIFAADHGIALEGVSAYPQEVTYQMVYNFLRGGAAINVFASQHNISLHIIDAGVNHEFNEPAGLINRKIDYGTKSFLNSYAMSQEQLRQALNVGSQLAMDIIDRGGSNTLGFGEMGIGNTSSAAMLTHLLCGIPLEKCTGAGTGLDPSGILRKITILENSLKHFNARNDTMEILASYGGFEIIMMAGAMLAAASRKALLLIDGFISTAALLAAWSINKNVIDYCIFSHLSPENGHKAQLEFLKAEPLLQLGMRLGEGTGAALAIPLLQSACSFVNEMASFESAKVSTSS